MDRAKLNRGLAETERAILVALGWRVEKTSEITGDDRIADGWYLVFNYSRYSTWKPSEELAWKSLPKLSDPGVFWPMFQEWFKATYQGDASGDNWYCGFGLSTYFCIFLNGQRYQQFAPELTEAGIHAWHAALVAVGKITDSKSFRSIWTKRTP